MIRPEGPGTPRPQNSLIIATSDTVQVAISPYNNTLSASLANVPPPTANAILLPPIHATHEPNQQVIDRDILSSLRLEEIATITAVYRLSPPQPHNANTRQVAPVENRENTSHLIAVRRQRNHARTSTIFSCCLGSIGGGMGSVATFTLHLPTTGQIAAPFICCALGLAIARNTNNSAERIH